MQRLKGPRDRSVIASLDATMNQSSCLDTGSIDATTARPRSFPGNPASQSDVAASLISITIVTYNSFRWLPGCLRSIKAQTYDPIEITIVDNASSDETRSYL